MAAVAIDVVLCGHVRTEVALYAIVSEILRARAEGLVRQIVFSTWTSEGERYPELFEALRNLGIGVVTLDPPAPYSNTMVIQQLQFWRGLQALDSADGWVMRTRTDKAFIHTADMFKALRSGALNPGDERRPTGVLSHRIIVPAVSVNEAFAHNDLLFLAHKDDCRRIMNFDAAFDYVFNDTGYFPVEARWFVAPIMARHPQLKTLFESVNVYRLGEAITLAAQRGQLADAPDAVFSYLAAYWSIAGDLFGVTDLENYGSATPLESLLDGTAPERPLTVRWGSRLLTTNQVWLDRLARGAMVDDAVGRRAGAHYVAPSDFGAALGRLDLTALEVFTNTIMGPGEQPAPRAARHAARAPVVGGDRTLIKALMRGRAPGLDVEEAYAWLEKTVDEDRTRSGDHTAYVASAQALEEAARAENDRDKARLAFMMYLSAAWARSSAGVDGACNLALDGLVDNQQRREAFETVYSVWMIDQTSPLALFWYGIEHLYGWTNGVINEEHGMRLIQQSADGGFHRAIDFLSARG